MFRLKSAIIRCSWTVFSFHLRIRLNITKIQVLYVLKLSVKTCLCISALIPVFQKNYIGCIWNCVIIYELEYVTCPNFSLPTFYCCVSGILSVSRIWCFPLTPSMLLSSSAFNLLVWIETRTINTLLYLSTHVLHFFIKHGGRNAHRPENKMCSKELWILHTKFSPTYSESVSLRLQNLLLASINRIARRKIYDRPNTFSETYSGEN
jgi:hypothetical protein